MPRYGKRLSPQLPVLHTLLEPNHRHPLGGDPEAHIEPSEIVYALVVDPDTRTHDGHQSLLGPPTILLCYPVQLLGRLFRQRVPQGGAELPFAALPESPALHLHEPFPPHAP